VADEDELPPAPILASIDRGWREISAIDEAYARGEIDRDGWHARIAALIVPAFLRGDNPRAQSGYSGTEEEWGDARSLIAAAIPRSGTFLDVGCASGLLMEDVRRWCGERALEVEPYGLDISPELAALARSRLPAWADRIFVGNAAHWQPPFRFDFVRTGHDYVPPGDQRSLFAHLLEAIVAPRGRLLIGSYTEERDETRAEPSLEERIRSWGFDVAGRIDRPHRRDARVIRRLLFIDR